MLNQVDITDIFCKALCFLTTLTKLCLVLWLCCICTIICDVICRHLVLRGIPREVHYPEQEQVLLRKSTSCFSHIVLPVSGSNVWSCERVCRVSVFISLAVSSCNMWLCEWVCHVSVHMVLAVSSCNIWSCDCWLFSDGWNGYRVTKICWPHWPLATLCEYN